MNWLDTAANVAQILSVIGPFIVFLVVMGVKISKKLDAIEAQQKPNGGSSMRDAIDKIDHRLDSVERNIANLRGAFDEHTRSK